MKKLAAILILVLFPSIIRAQTLDDFHGLMSVSCSTLNNEQAATFNQSSGSTTVTAAVSNGAAYWVGEYIQVINANSTLNTVFNGSVASAGADQITSIASNTLTMTSPITAGATQTNISGDVTADYFYTSSAITTTYGTRAGFCTPEGHWYFPELMSDAADGPSPGEALHFSYTPTSNTASSGTVTMNFSNNWVTLGMHIVVASCSDANYNGTWQTTSAKTTGITYSDASAGASATGCVITPYAWDQYKYNGGSATGVACAGAMGQLKRLLAMGFDGIGEDSDSQYLYNGGCAPPSGYAYTPVFMGGSTPGASRYAQINLWGCAPQALKTPTYALDRSLTGLLENDLDWFDPHWSGFMACAFGSTHEPANGFNSPFLIGTSVDDTDAMGQTRSGPWWHPDGSTGATQVIPSLMVMYAPPQITLSDQSIYGGNANSLPTLFPINTLYSKALSTSQPAGCWADTAGTTSPGGNPVGPTYSFCSLADWLRNEYGTVANLNSAWSSTYTTFGSSQTVYTNESHTLTDTALTHSGVTPRSVAVSLTPSGGSAVMVAGDCQAGAGDCPAGTAGTGKLLAPGNCYNSNGSFYQSTGIACVDSNGSVEEVTTAGEETTVATWPATSSCSGTQTTTNGTVVFTCLGPNISGSITYSTAAVTFTAGGAGSLPSGETMSVSYTTAGWDAGGTGVLDEDGSHSWTTSNGICLVSPPAWQASHAYTAYDDGSVVEFQVGGLNYYAMAIKSFTSGSTAPAWVSTVGTQLGDGSTTAAWVVLGKPPSDPSNGYGFNVACGTNQAFASDMNAWIETYVGKYLSVVQTTWKTINPSLLNFGVNFGANDWSDPTWEGVFKAEQIFTDAGFWGDIPNGSQALGQASDPQLITKENYAFTYFHKPVIIEEFESANNWETLSNVGSCSGSVNCWKNLEDRGQGFYSQISDMLNFSSDSGGKYYAGVTWWTDHCGNAAGSACLGLFDNDDNLANGMEDVTATVACSNPLSSLSCGGEYGGVPWLNVHGENGLIAALALPYGGAGSSVACVGFAPQPCAPTDRAVRQDQFPPAPRVGVPFVNQYGEREVRVTGPSTASNALGPSFKYRSIVTSSSSEKQQIGILDPALFSGDGGYRFTVHDFGGSDMGFEIDAKTFALASVNTTNLSNIDGDSATASSTDSSAFFGMSGTSLVVYCFPDAPGTGPLCNSTFFGGTFKDSYHTILAPTSTNCPGLPTLPTVFTEASADHSDSYFTVAYASAQDNPGVFIWYNRNNGHCDWFNTNTLTVGGSDVTGTPVITWAPTTGSPPTTGSFGIHQVRVSQGGDWAFVDSNSTGFVGFLMFWNVKSNPTKAAWCDINNAACTGHVVMGSSTLLNEPCSSLGNVACHYQQGVRAISLSGMGSFTDVLQAPPAESLGVNAGNNSDTHQNWNDDNASDTYPYCVGFVSEGVQGSSTQAQLLTSMQPFDREIDCFQPFSPSTAWRIAPSHNTSWSNAYLAGSTLPSWTASTTYGIDTVGTCASSPNVNCIVDASGSLEEIVAPATGTCTSGTVAPSFPGNAASIGSNTTDGTCTWTLMNGFSFWHDSFPSVSRDGRLVMWSTDWNWNLGYNSDAVTTVRWASGATYQIDVAGACSATPGINCIVDSNGNIEEITAPTTGTCIAATGNEPTWPVTVGTTTVDNTCTWTLKALASSQAKYPGTESRADVFISELN